MKSNYISQQIDERFLECKYFLARLKIAQEECLDVEFLDSFFQDYLHTKSITQSTDHASREWDL